MRYDIQLIERAFSSKEVAEEVENQRPLFESMVKS
jgi:hypothetical protein